MTRLVTLVGYGAIAMCALGLELWARRRRRLATFGEVLEAVLQWWPSRALVLVGWLWLGWHLFARAG